METIRVLMLNSAAFLPKDRRPGCKTRNGLTFDPPPPPSAVGSERETLTQYFSSSSKFKVMFTVNTDRLIGF